jgi:hypothetical protein
MDNIIVIIAILAGIGLCIWLYKANKKLIEGIEKKRLHYEKLSRTIDGLRGLTYFIEVNATENYFPKE